MIFGLPNESEEAAKDYASILSDTKANFVKLHHLQIVEGSLLAKLYKKNTNLVKLHDLNSYIEKVSIFLSYLNKDIYIERFINRVPQNMLIAPKFGNINENKFTLKLSEYMTQNNLSQGSKIKKI